MYRAALRATTPRALRPAATPAAPCRLASTASKAKKGTWKGAALRWGLAAGAVYFYNTSSLFESDVPPQSGPAPSPFSDADLPTVDALVQEKRKQALPRPAPKAAAPAEKQTAAVAAAPVAKPETAPEPQLAASETAEKEEGGLTESAGALEQEAAAEGAFNPETGEINWDCPCLGGMAHGPCGEQFKAAFSCFVYSTEEPKGMDCIDKFQGMQDCFREYPELYGAELSDDDTPTFDEESKKPAELPGPASESSQAPSTPEAEAVKEVVKEKVKGIKEEVFPETSHDATTANKDKTQ